MWRAFWKDEGHPLSLLTGLVRESLGPGPVPTTLVAHEVDVFLGTVSLIACDEESRPHYTPWVAALWVEPEHRRRGLGEALVGRAVILGFSTGAGSLYLLTSRRRRTYYERLGWSVREENVPQDGMDILGRAEPTIAPESL